MTRILSGCIAVAFAMWTTVAQAASLSPGQSVDFSFDFSGQGAVSISGFGASCAADASCVFNNDELMGDGDSIGFWAGTTLGGTELFSATLTDTNLDGFGLLSISSSLSPFIAVDAATDQIFVRIIANDGPVMVGSVNLSVDATDTLFGTEIAVVPNPAVGSGMLLGLVGLAWLGRKRRQTLA